MYNKTVLFAIISMLFLIGCLANLDKYPKEKCAAMPDANVVNAIHDNCIKCHARDYTTPADICVRKNMIIDAVKTKRMPKIGTLYDYYYKAIVEWK